MDNEWPLKTLSELGVELIDCLHKTPQAAEIGIPYIGIPQMKNGEIDFKANPRLISKEDFAIWTEKVEPKFGDIVMSRRCNPGETAAVPKNKPFALGQNLVLLRPDPAKVHPGYLRWVVLSHQWWSEVEKYRNPGAVFDSLKCADVPKFKVPEPPRFVQEKIDECLLSITKKINLNREINLTMEQMAQALFKSWFIDFDPVIDNALAAGNPIPEELQHRAELRKQAHKLPDFKPLPKDILNLFPSEFEQTNNPDVGVAGWVPNGWTMSSVNEVSERIGMGPFGSNIKSSTFVKTGIPILNGQQLKGLFVEEKDHKFITEEHADKLNKSVVKSGDLVFTHRGTIGQVSLVPNNTKSAKFVVSQSQFFLRPNLDKTGKYYLLLFFQSAKGQYELLSNSSQVGVPSIARPSTHLKGIKLLVPDNKVTEAFEEYCDLLFNKYAEHKNQTRTLNLIRNTLLPKLISGEVSINNISKDEKVA